MKCTALRGEPGALIDACIHLATTNDLHMQFDIVIIISTEHNTCTFQSQCTSNSAAIYMNRSMVLKICTGTYFMTTGTLTVK